MSLLTVKSLQLGKKKKRLPQTHIISYTINLIWCHSVKMMVQMVSYLYLKKFALLFSLDLPLERYYYVCCRDGNYKPSKQPRKTNKKRPYQKPSRKLEMTCISRMYVTKFSSGKMDVKFISAHDPDEDEAGFVPLPVSTKEEIALKLSVGISIERIMEGR